VSTGLALTVSLLLLAANAFFVGAEFALVSARRSVIEPRAEEGGRRAKATLAAMENVSLMMAGAQLGITLCTLGLGALAEPALAGLLRGPFAHAGLPSGATHAVALTIALLFVGGLHVILGEMVPKNLALAGPDRSALLLAPPLALTVKVLHPVIALLNWIANSVIRLAGVQPRQEVASAFTRDEVAGLVEESRREGKLDSHESSLLSGALSFEDRDVGTVLLAPEEVVTLPLTVTPAEIEETVARTGFSRFPITADGRMLGFIHLKDTLEVKERHRNRPISRSWVHDLPEVSRGAGLRQALETMQRDGAHLARVVGAGHTTVGVIALEDVLEELVGEISDATRKRGR